MILSILIWTFRLLFMAILFVPVIWSIATGNILVQVCGVIALLFLLSIFRGLLDLDEEE